MAFNQRALRAVWVNLLAASVGGGKTNVAVSEAVIAFASLCATNTCVSAR